MCSALRRCETFSARCRASAPTREAPLARRSMAYPTPVERNHLKHGYPRPQLERDDWLCLNGPWQFCFDDEGQYDSPADVRVWPLTIEVPYPPESTASGLGDRGFHKTYWYQRDVRITPGDGRTILRFGAVDYSAKVWVNGHLAVLHEGGHTPFGADITHLQQVLYL